MVAADSNLAQGPVWLLIDNLSAAATLAAFLVLAVALIAALSGQHRLVNKVLAGQSANGLTPLAVLASICMMAWAAAAILASHGLVSNLAVQANGSLRLAALLAICGWLARVGGVPWWVITSALASGLIIAVLTLGTADPVTIAGLAACVAGLILLFMMTAANRSDRLYAFKWFGLAVVPVFLIDALLLTGIARFSGMLAPQGVVNALAAPCLAVALARAPAWGPPVFISRQVAYGALVALVLGAALGSYLILLLLMDGLPETLYRFGALNAAVLLAVGVALMFASGAVRARVAAFIDRHFFANRYDYRLAWQQFLDAVDGPERDPKMDLINRLTTALTSTLGLTAAALWRVDEGQFFRLAAGQNFGEKLTPEFTSPDLAQSLAIAPPVPDQISTRSLRQLPGAALPAAWLIIPIRRHGRLLGCLALAAPLDERPLSGEDGELIRLMADQIASYLSEEMAAQALNDARAFDDFNRRFAFVLHDVKNVAHQLNLTLDNAKRHRNNPAFYDTLLSTLAAMDHRLRGLIQAVRKSAINSAELTDLNDLVVSVVEECGDARLSADLAPNLVAPVDAMKLGGVLRHLIDNALEALPDDAPYGKNLVKIELRPQGELAIITITDQGGGMSDEFIANKLFRPFATTKANGLGIGLVQAKSTIEAMNGALSVQSQLNAGTVITLRLPLSNKPAPNIASIRELNG